jgi:glycosyltransferase involved in cell wall biosynthesis
MKALVFYPHNLEPPRTGADRRCREVLFALRELGYQVILASSPLCSASEWDSDSVLALSRSLVDEVQLYRPESIDRSVQGLVARWYRLKGSDPPLGSHFWTPPQMRHWFRRVCAKVGPDVLLMSYSIWDGIVRHRAMAGVQRIVDSLDLHTLNVAMQRVLIPHLAISPLRVDGVPAEILAEDFFSRGEFHADPEEFAVFDRYDTTLAVSRREEREIRLHTRRTDVRYVPVTMPARAISNTYAGLPLFAIGPNFFNLQGVAYLARRVVPRVRRSVHHFDLLVTGSTPGNVSLALEPGMRFLGFLADLSDLYASAPFAVCPVFGGTGQQIKVVEAMAHGVPVIALRQAAEASPIRHGETGLVADTAEEFAAHVCRLWEDREECRRLGHAARETVAAEFSRARLVDEMDKLLAGQRSAVK